MHLRISLPKPNLHGFNKSDLLLTTSNTFPKSLLNSLPEHVKPLTSILEMKLDK